MWLCAIVLATWEKYNELRDPTYNHFVDTGNFQVQFIIFWKTISFDNIAIVFVFTGFSNIFLHILCNVLALSGITHTESIQ